MDRVPKDVLIDLALELSLADLLNLCRSSSTAFICYSDVFWAKKLEKDYGIVGVNNPKQAYKNIPIFREHCKILVERKVVDGYNFVLEDITPEYFDDFNDYVVFKFLLSKILNRGAGLVNYYNIEHNKIPDTHVYKPMITPNSQLSYGEYMIFKKLLSDITKSRYMNTFPNSFEKAYIDMMIRGDIPLFIKWGELCKYNIY